MSRPCPICIHPRRAEVDAWIAEGRLDKSIGLEIGKNPDKIRGHRERCWTKPPGSTVHASSIDYHDIRVRTDLAKAGLPDHVLATEIEALPALEIDDGGEREDLYRRLHNSQARVFELLDLLRVMARKKGVVDGRSAASLAGSMARLLTLEAQMRGYLSTTNNSNDELPVLHVAMTVNGRKWNPDDDEPQDVDDSAGSQEHMALPS